MSALLDLKAAAKYLGVDYDAARAYVAKGLLRAVRLPSLSHNGPRRKIQVRLEDLDEFIAQSEIPGAVNGAEVHRKHVEMAPKRRRQGSANYVKDEWVEKFSR